MTPSNDIAMYEEGQVVRRSQTDRRSGEHMSWRVGKVTRVYKSIPSHAGGFHFLYGVTWNDGSYDEGYMNGGLVIDTSLTFSTVQNV